MKTENPQVIAKPAFAYSDTEIADFIAFVLAGGEVISHRLEDRVRSAESLAFLRSNGCLLGVAGLKRPSQNHRNEIASLSGVPLASTQFPFELGWVFILPSARGRHLSLPLCRPLIETAADQGVFATSKAENCSMHSTLNKLGFVTAGVPHKSMRGNYFLQTFLRPEVATIVSVG